MLKSLATNITCIYLGDKKTGDRFVHSAKSLMVEKETYNTDKRQKEAYDKVGGSIKL